MPAIGVAYYAELECLSTSWFRVGLASADLSSYTVLPETAARVLCATDDGNIFNGGGSAIQTGLATVATGDRIGVRYRNDAGTPKVQFYRNGFAHGSEITLATSHASQMLGGVPARLLFGTGTITTATVLMHTDAADLRYLPVGSQPWGAAIRAADAGGYTPALAGFHNGALGTSAISVSGGRALTATVDNRIGYAGGATRSGVRYVEFLIEVFGTFGALVGLVRPTANLNNFTGSDADGWGYYAGDGARYNSGTPTFGYATFSVNDRIGVLINSASGHIWFLKNGVVQGGGSPELGTSPAYTGVTGDLRPAAVSYTGGRIRICTHPAEMLHLPDYAEAWDGAAPPEAHFAGLLKPGTEIQQAVRFPQWGGQSVADGSPVGRVNVINAGGQFDTPGTKWLLRDEALTLFTLSDCQGLADGVADWEAAAIVDSVALEGEDEFTIVAQSALARLDRQASTSPVLLMGAVRLAPLRLVGNATLTYQLDAGAVVASYNSGGQPDHLDLRGGGLPLTTWVYAATDIAYGIRRTVNPATGERHAIANAVAMEDAAPSVLTNSSFANWTAGAPDGWTTNIAGAGNVSQSFAPAGARIQRPGGGDTAELWQGPISTGIRTWVLARITVASYTSGDLELVCTYPIASTKDFGINATGTFLALFIGDSFDDSNWLIRAKAGTDMVVSASSLATQRAKLPSIRTPFDLAGFSQAEVGTRVEPFGTIPETVGVGGYYSEDSPSCRELAELFARSSMAVPYTDERGRVRWASGNALPSDISTTALGYRGALLASDVLGAVSYSDDIATALSTRAATAINYARHQESEVFAAATVAQRELVTLPFAVENYNFGSNALHPFYLHAENGEPVPVLLGALTGGWQAAAAYKARLGFYRLEVSRVRARGLRVGHLLDFTYPRFGLSAKRLMVVGITRRLGLPEVQLTLWG
jgi:hypothetical protein